MTPEEFTEAVLNDIDNPRTHPFVTGLRRDAEHGGEFGTAFDRGVLSVVEQVETTGTYTRHPRAGGVVDYASGLLRATLMKDELTDIEAWMAAQPMSRDDVLQYARGIKYAEGFLAQFRAPTG
jgi:hypothetical protein